MMKLNECLKCGGKPALRDSNDRSGVEYRCSHCGNNGGRKNTGGAAILAWNSNNPPSILPTSSFIAVIGDEFRISGKPKTYILKKLRREVAKGGRRKTNIYDLDGYGDVTEIDLVKHFIRVLPIEDVPVPAGYGGW